MTGIAGADANPCVNEPRKMRLFVLGASGRTGRAVLSVAKARGHDVIAYSRKPFAAPEGAEVILGEVLDATAMTAALRGCDAVVCAIGPAKGSPPDLDSRLAEVFLVAMRATGVKQLAIVTGAMQAGPASLGAFYRWLARLDSARVLIDDRKILERRLLESGLEVTILRPPQLTSGPRSVGGPELTTTATITMMDGCSRSDLADALVRAVEPRALHGAIFVRSRPRALAFWGPWLLRCGLAELAGIGLAAVVAISMTRLVGEPQTIGMKWLVYASFLVTGALEGAFIGLAQGSLLKRLVPSLRLLPFTLWTMFPAVLAWAVGMGPSTFLATTSATAASPVTAPPVGLVLLLSAVGGALGGLLIGGSQWLEVRKHVTSARAWVIASVAGWALALPLDMLGATLPDASTPPWLIALSAAGFGLLAGPLHVVDEEQCCLHDRASRA